MAHILSCFRRRSRTGAGRPRSDGRRLAVQSWNRPTGTIGSWRVTSSREPVASGLELLAVVRGLEALDQPSRVTLVTQESLCQSGVDVRVGDLARTAAGSGSVSASWSRSRTATCGSGWTSALKFHRVECRRWRLDGAAPAQGVAGRPLRRSAAAARPEPAAAGDRGRQPTTRAGRPAPVGRPTWPASAGCRRLPGSWPALADRAIEQAAGPCWPTSQTSIGEICGPVRGDRPADAGRVASNCRASVLLLRSHGARSSRRPSVRTQVALRAVGPLIHGHHEDPFELLGPHDVVAGRPQGDGGPGVPARYRAGVGDRSG